MTPSEARDILPEYLLGTLDRARARDLEAALAASPELRAEADALGRALFALPEALEPEPLPADAWDRLRSAVASGAGAHAGVDGSPRPRSAPALVLALALAASLVLLTGVGAWGVRSAQERTELGNEQRIISYWMRNPELRIVSLDGVGPGAAGAENAPAEVPPGIVCVLPDGRAMLLQPYPAPAGSRYVLYGVGSEGRTELGSTRDRFLLFDATELEGVEVVVAGRPDAVVARASF